MDKEKRNAGNMRRRIRGGKENKNFGEKEKKNRGRKKIRMRGGEAGEGRKERGEGGGGEGDGGRFKIPD